MAHFCALLSIDFKVCRLIGLTETLSDHIKKIRLQIVYDFHSFFRTLEAREGSISIAGTSSPLCRDNANFVMMLAIGGGSYWAGRAAARPLFGLCGPPIGLARPLLAT